MSRLLVVVLTKNEAAHLGACLGSLDDLECDILVVDSGSTDETIEIAEKFGADVVYHEYITEAATRNWVLDTYGPETGWLLFLDADERLTPGLNREIRDLPDPADGPSGYYMRREMRFLGHELRYGGHQRNYILHLLQPSRARVISQTRTLEYVKVDGPTQVLRNSMIHENKRSLSDWVMKHDFYAQREAEDRLAGFTREKPVTEGRIRAYLHKAVLARMPPLALPFAFFTYRYFIRLGFLDGKVGLIYYAMHDIWYPTLIAAKLVELDPVGGGRRIRQSA